MRTDDAERRVRSWLETGPERAPDELIESVLAQVPAVRRRPRWMVSRRLGGRVGALVAAAIVASLLVASAWVLPGRLGSPGVSNPDQGTFVQVATPPDFAAISDAIPVGGGILATGTTTFGGHDSIAVWSSPDGRTWIASPPAPLFEDATSGRLAEQANRVVILAFKCQVGGSYCGESTMFVATVGAPWQAVSGIGAGAYDAVIAGGPGFVAVGSGNTSATEVQGYVATSSDGSTWSEIAPADMAGARIGGVAAGPARLIAVGQAGQQPAAWISTDARTWTRVAGGPSGGTLSDVAFINGRWVAVGTGSGRSMAWTSGDGSNWQAVPAGSGPDGASLTRIVQVGSRVIALGQSTSGAGAAWQSVDGTSWTRLQTGDIFDQASISAVASDGGNLALFGVTATGHSIVAMGAP
jgi:hypothetical protein